jgi:hypothetical protein
VSPASRADRPLRAAAVVLVPPGLALHLWLGTRIPLAAAGVGLACHVAAVVTARRRARRRAA